MANLSDILGGSFSGYVGSRGATGYSGSLGYTGSIGYTGSASTVQGPIGYTGSQGIQGVIGYTGSQGIQGVIGYTGSQGIQGVIGYTGSQGIQGVIGYTGSLGYTGSASTVIGYTGSQGVIGYTGSQGQAYNRVTYTTTTAVTQGYYRIATIPIGTTIKACSFVCKGYTATGTVTESTVDVNVAYYSGSTASSTANIVTQNAHSFDSRTNAENGWVFAYFRISFDATSAYIDVYKYKTTAVTIETTPLVQNDWTWHTGALTVNPTVGSLESMQVDTYAGLCSGGNSRVSYASSAGYATYPSYGVYGTYTKSDNVDKTGLWMYYTQYYIAYNASYLYGNSIDTVIELQEITANNMKTISSLEKINVHLKSSMPYFADSTAFNTAVPNLWIGIEGNTTLTANDFAVLVSATSTGSKDIRLYIKLKDANTHYIINCKNRYGMSYNATYTVSNNYNYLNHSGNNATLTVLPTPAQGSVVYGEMLSSGVSTGKAIAMAIVFG